jgi:hypothetical protein
MSERVIFFKQTIMNQNCTVGRISDLFRIVTESEYIINIEDHPIDHWGKGWLEYYQYFHTNIIANWTNYDL